MKRTFSTDRELKALKPGADWVDVVDSKTPGLLVRVGPLNAKKQFKRTFCYAARFPGSTSRVRAALGEYDLDLTLEQAREKAGEWRRLIRDGIDPRKQAEKAAEEAESQRKLRFDVLMEDYVKRRLPALRSGPQVEQMLRRDVLPFWKDKLITDIKRPDVIEVVEAVIDRGSPGQARNTLFAVRAFLNWVVTRGVMETSPCDRLDLKNLLGKKKVRQRVLLDHEIRAFWQACGRLAYPYGDLFKLLLVTGQRRTEVAEASWPEIDTASKLFVVPPSRFKSDAEHRVPLSPMAMEVIDSLPRFKSSDAKYLFSVENGRKPVSGYADAKVKLDAAMLEILREADPEAVLPPFVLHDLRRTMRTRLSSLRIPTEVAEMVIGHAKTGLARVYDLHAFEDEMRDALDRWAAKLQSIVNPTPPGDNVIGVDFGALAQQR